MLPTVEETRGYDFQDPENAEKWKGLLVNSLKKVQHQRTLCTHLAHFLQKSFSCLGDSQKLLLHDQFNYNATV